MDQTMVRKSLVDYISEEDYPRYQELLNKAEQLKANAPKPERKPRGPMTKEQKLSMAKKAAERAQAKLDALLAAQGI